MRRIVRSVATVLGCALFLLVTACANEPQQNDQLQNDQLQNDQTQNDQLQNDQSQNDPYEGYTASGIEAKLVSWEQFEDPEIFEGFLQETQNGVVIFRDFETYAAADLPLDRNEGFFAENDLMVFCAQACSSDNMKYSDIMAHEGKLYPCFLRDHISSGAPVTDDVLFLPYVASLRKSDGFEAGEVIFRERNSAKYRLNTETNLGYEYSRYLQFESPDRTYWVGQDVSVKVDIDPCIELVLDGIWLKNSVKLENGFQKEYHFEMPAHDATLSIMFVDFELG